MRRGAETKGDRYAPFRLRPNRAHGWVKFDLSLLLLFDAALRLPFGMRVPFVLQGVNSLLPAFAARGLPSSGNRRDVSGFEDI